MDSINNEKIPLEYFSDEQRYYIEQLTKFAGRTNRTRIATSQEIPSKKFNFIKQNFSLLTIDEQYDFNSSNQRLKERRQQSYGIGVITGLIAMGCFIAYKPLHQKLYLEAAKSSVMGLMFGAGYYQYFNYQSREELHEMYIKVMNRKKLSKI